MTSPSYEDRVIAMFDSFNKRVSRNFLIDLQRAYDSRNKYYSNEPVEYLLDLVGHRDEYPAHAFEFYVGERVCRVRDERLFQALRSLPDRQREVLLWGFWVELLDEEIAKKMEVSVRTVYNLRQRAFRAIEKHYGEKSTDYAVDNGLDRTGGTGRTGCPG